MGFYLMLIALGIIAGSGYMEYRSSVKEFEDEKQYTASTLSNVAQHCFSSEDKRTGLEHMVNSGNYNRGIIGPLFSGSDIDQVCSKGSCYKG
jgi:hypothetical protein